MNRFGTVIVSKLNRLVNRLEDPRETLDYSYEEQLVMLKAVKKGIVDVSASKNSLINQNDALQAKADKLEEQAKSAVKQGRDDLATVALEQKHTLLVQVGEMTSSIDALQHEEDALIKTQKDIEVKLEMFKTKKEVLKAQYSAASAMSQINESIAGIGDGLTDIGTAVERIESKTNDMKSRATAIDDLMSKGVLTNVIGENKSPIERELSKVDMASAVSSDLTRLKSEVAPFNPSN